MNQGYWIYVESFKQTFKQFEIIIADDGSNEETKSVIDAYKPLSIKHVWHEDKGSRKNLNKAIFQKKKLLNQKFEKKLRINN